MAPPLPGGGDLRLERKFTARGLPPAAVEEIARGLPGGFARAHPDRAVNSLYLDAPDRPLLALTVDGAPDRLKARIRWYGPLETRAGPALELKIKRGLLGRKLAWRLPALDLRFPGLSADLLATLRRHDALPAAVRELLAPLRPAFVNRYERAYLASACGRFRITVDRAMAAFTPEGRPAGWPVPGRVVLELKYAPEHDAAAREIASRLPFRLDRHSKFVDAVAAAGARP